MRIPRKTLAASLTATLAFGVVAAAYGDGASDNTSQVTASLSPSLQKDDQRKKASLFTQVTTLDNDNSPVIPAESSEVVEIDFPAEMKYKANKFLDTCAPIAVATATTDEAVTLCKKALIGSGTAYARIPGFPTTNNETELTVSAFNGPKTTPAKAKGPGTGPTIVLHADNAALPTTVVEGFIVDSPNGPDFGSQLNVPDAPDVAGDTGALVLFNAQVAKKYNNGKKGNKRKKFDLISVSCEDTPGDGDWDFRAFWEYDDASNETDLYAQDCTEK